MKEDPKFKKEIDKYLLGLSAITKEAQARDIGESITEHYTSRPRSENLKDFRLRTFQWAEKYLPISEPSDFRVLEGEEREAALADLDRKKREMEVWRDELKDQLSMSESIVQSKEFQDPGNLKSRGFLESFVNFFENMMQHLEESGGLDLIENLGSSGQALDDHGGIAKESVPLKNLYDNIKWEFSSEGGSGDYGYYTEEASFLLKDAIKDLDERIELIESLYAEEPVGSEIEMVQTPEGYWSDEDALTRKLREESEEFGRSFRGSPEFRGIAQVKVIEGLAKLADSLDQEGKHIEADLIDTAIQKITSS